MNLESAVVHQLDIPMDREYHIAGKADSTMHSILLVMETTDGIRGIGAADPALGHSIPQTTEEIVTSLVEFILPDVIDANPDNPNQLLELLAHYDQAENARCAAEMAYIDLYCRQRGQSVSDLLGGRLRDTVPLNAWVGIDTPDTMAEEAEHWNNRGFGSLKMKISGDKHRDAERIHAVCERVGNEMGVRVDANEGYDDVDEAIEMARAIEGLPVSHLEQPISRDDLGGLAKITAATSIDIMADESVQTVSDGYDILKRDAADRLKFKILQTGGILPVRKGLDMAAAANVKCVVGHGFCTSPAASAELQLAAAHGNIYGPLETVGTLKMADEPFDSSLSIKNGSISIPDKPGLGINVLDDELYTFSTERYVIR